MFSAENGLSQPNLTLAQKRQKLTPHLGSTRAGAKQPTLCPSSTNSPKILMQLSPRRLPGILAPVVATWGQDAHISKVGHLGRPVRVGLCRDLVEPSFDSQALISALVGCIGFGDTNGQKTARIAKLGNIARTVSCITLTRPEEHILTPRAIDPLSSPTRIALSSGYVPSPMEIWCSQPGLKWQKQRNLLETAHTHDPISPWVWRGITQPKSLGTHGS